MKVRVFGLSLDSCDFVSPSTLISGLREHAEHQQTKLEEFLREEIDTLPVEAKPLLAIEDLDDEYLAGVTLKVRDARSFFKLSASTDGISFKSEPLGEGIRQGEVNFFLMRKENLNCLYAYHHQSTHMGAFAGIARLVHNKITDAKRSAINEQQESGDLTRREAQDAREQLTPPFRHSLFLSRLTAAEMVSRLNAVKNAMLFFKEPETQLTNDVAPLSNDSKTTSIRMTFDTGNRLEMVGIKEKLVGLIRGNKLKKMRVEGLDPMDAVVNILLEDNPDHFAQKDYDELFSEENQVSAGFSQLLTESNVVAWLRDVANRDDVKSRLEN